jgi:beta-phosphoglucomutase
VTTALQGIIFDFDGVIADSEPLHFRAFQQTLSEDGLEISPKEYYARYLGYDDVGMFQAFGEDRGVPMDDARVAGLVTRKGQKLQAMLTTGAVLFPGAIEFIRSAAGAVPIAIASGALRHEIDEVVVAAGVAGLFSAIVASGDTPESKPSPAPYSLAFDGCARRRQRRSTRRGAWRSRTRAGGSNPHAEPGYAV